MSTSREDIRNQLDAALIQGSELELMLERYGAARGDLHAAVLCRALNEILQRAIVWSQNPKNDPQVVDVLNAIGHIQHDPRLGP